MPWSSNIIVEYSLSLSPRQVINVTWGPSIEGVDYTSPLPVCSFLITAVTHRVIRPNYRIPSTPPFSETETHQLMSKMHTPK